MLPLLGIVGAAVLMMLANTLGNDTLFMISSVLMLLFGAMYFRR